jgi:quercetin dioxygenase-like cupin family protein
MAIPHVYPGMPVVLRSEEVTLSETRTTALVKNDTFEAIRLVARKGHEICHDHQVEGMLTVHCLEGLIAFTADGTTRELGAGQMLVLAAGEPHSVVGLEDSAVLVTKVLPANPPSP